MRVVKGFLGRTSPKIFVDWMALRDAFSKEGKLSIVHGSDAGHGSARVPGKQGAQAIGQGVILEVRYAEEAFGGLLDVLGHDTQATIMVQYTGGEEHDGKQQGQQVAQSLILEHTHVLEVIAGLT